MSGTFAPAMDGEAYAAVVCECILYGELVVRYLSL